MKQNNKVKLAKLAVCFAIEVLIAFFVIWSKGFFTESAAVNLQILADAFFVSGILMTLFAGLIFVSDEGALIGIGYIMRYVVLTFIPMGRTKHERYIDYRARKLENAQKREKSSMLIAGLFFLVIGVVLTIIWSVKFYNV